MSNSLEQRKLAANMFTDMVSYSALSQRDEALALEMLEEHRAIVRGILSPSGGRKIKTIGDGFLLEFPRWKPRWKSRRRCMRATTKRRRNAGFASGSGSTWGTSWCARATSTATA